jgi:hypothetical protein
MPSIKQVLAGTIAVTAVTAAAVFALASPASASVTGWEAIRGQSLSNSAPVKAAVASCTNGKVLVGTGGRVDGAYGEAHVEAIRPSTTSVEVVAYEDENGFAGNWSVSAFAICTYPLDGLEIVTATSSAGTSATATCTGNRRVLGTGVEILGGGGEVIISKVAPLDDRVIASGNPDDTGTTNIWLVKAYAICADAPAGLEIRSVTSTSISDSRSWSYGCDPDQVLTGGGAYIYPYTGQVSFFLNPVDFSGGYQFMFVQGYEDDDGWSSNWSITTYAVCADE